MQETLHFSKTSQTPLHTPNTTFPLIPRPKKHLPFPTPPKPQPTISLPIKTNPTISHPQNVTIHELILYLDSLNIDSLQILNTHPQLLSTPLPQIKSTVDFLLSIGLTTQDLRRIFPMCPDLLTSPHSTTVIPATTFLLREVHVEASKLRYVIHRRPRLLTCDVPRQLRPTLYFLQGTIGIDDVSKCAWLLSCCVETKFVPRMEYFRGVGFSEKETVKMFRRFPALFCYSVEGNLKLKFDYFVVEMGRGVKELVEFPQYFSFSLENRIKPRHRLCVEKGVCLGLPVMLKSTEGRLTDLLEVCCSSSPPVRASPFWCSTDKDR